MNVIDEATKYLMPSRGWCDQHHKGEGGDPCMYCEHNAHQAALILYGVDLLAPELPEPLIAANGNPVWRADGTLMVTRYPDGEIRMLVGIGKEARYTPESARAQAALLLAAAKEEPEAHRER